MSTEQLPDGLKLAVNIIRESEWPEGTGGNPLDAVLNEHAQRLTLQHHAADQVWRIADLEVKCVTLKELHDAAADERDELRSANADLHSQVAYWHRKAVETRTEGSEIEGQLSGQLDVTSNELQSVMGERDALRVKVYDLERAAVKRREISDGVEAELVDECDTLRTLKIRAEAERDELRAKYDELLVALHGIGAALGIPEGDRSPYSVTCGALERVNRLAEIEAQEPVLEVRACGCEAGKNGRCVMGDYGLPPIGAKLYANPVPAQAVPDADGARFRWLCEDHSDSETRERCRSLIDRLSVMSYSDAVMSIDAAMAAAPEHTA